MPEFFSEIEYCKQSTKDLEEKIWAMRRDKNKRIYAVRIRGSKMKDFQSMSDELSACLQFPCYYGNNWDSIDECLQDLEWLLPEQIVLIVDEPHLIFPKNDENFSILMQIFEDALQVHNINEKLSRRLRIILLISEEYFDITINRLSAVNVKLSPFDSYKLEV